jgi:hypothetical protein
MDTGRKRIISLRTVMLIFFLALLSSCATFVRVNDPTLAYTAAKNSVDAYFIEDLRKQEKELLDWAAQYPRYRSFDEMNVENLKAIQEETESIDKAVAVFYHRAINHPPNRRFMEYVARKEEELANNPPDYSDMNLLFAFVPGMFFEDLAIVGLKGEPLIEAVTEMHIHSELVPVDQSGTVRENALIIRDYFREKAPYYDAIIVATASKGGGDFKQALYEYGDERFFDKIRCWLNIGGITSPSVLVDTVEEKWYLRTRAKFFFWLNRYQWAGFQSMGSTFRGEPGALTHELRVPEHMHTINIVGVPLEAHITNTARLFYKILSRHGPNDGFLMHGNSLQPRGLLYPAWRNDHYFQWSLPQERIQAFFTYAIDRYIHP